MNRRSAHHRSAGPRAGPQRATARKGTLLLLRLGMLRARPRGQASLAERGYSLAVALIAAFVLLLGVGALASRTQLGFVGQVFQGQNRQARDVAEAAIAEFVNTMNQERNRHLLIAGTTDNWQSANWAAEPADRDFRNVCTVFDDNLNPNLNAGNPVFVPPDPNAIARFTPGGPRDLVAGDNTRQFTIEDIEFLNEVRGDYVDNAGNFLDFVAPGAPGEANVVIPYGELYRSGRQRSLIRITALGTVTQNGRTSRARVAREFEVVPKCCKRSFGANVFGGVNWGRDGIPCGGEGADTAGLDGVIVGLAGSAIGGSANEKLGIIQEDGSTLRQAACYNGPVDPTSTIITANPNPVCTAGTMARGGISYNPTQLDFSPPAYNHPSGGNPVPASITVGNQNPEFIYFDPAQFQAASPASPNAFSGVVLSKPQGAGWNRTRLNGQALGSASVDPCYTQNIDTGGGRPYYVVNCLLSNISTQGSRRIFVDTSIAQINFFFVGNGSYATWSGNSGIYRIHGNNGVFRNDLNQAPARSACVEGNPDNCLIPWNNGDPETPAGRLNTFLELCSDRGYDCDVNNDGQEDYPIRRLMNFYANGTGTFTFNGLGAGVGFNIYAPNATVTMNGQGGFMGQLWTDRWNPNGNIQMRTFSGGGNNAGGGTPPPFRFGRALIDFVARSFTQSSGFGL